MLRDRLHPARSRQGDHQEIIFPATLVDPVSKIAEVRHNLIKVINCNLRPQFKNRMTLITAGLVVIKDRKLLLAFSNNKQAFYLPGGKADQGETTVMALVREVQEELNISPDPSDLAFYTHIQAPAFGEPEGVLMAQDCYRYELRQEPRPAAEIGALRYFDTAAYRQEVRQAPGVVMVMEQLQRDNLID
jgi:8-oxo-dGTP pyrophosphatase MutT (NUDIX family)